VRLAHFTDVHVQHRPRPSQLLGKRALGAANLYLLGRRKHFSAATREALVAAIEKFGADALVCTGDLTALASPEEFESARELLGPLFESRPSALVSGNHDTYTRAAWSGRRLERYFGEWMGSGTWPRLHLLGDEVACVALDVSIAAWHSAGRCSEEQLAGLDAVFSDPKIEGRCVFVMLHYPLRDRHGAPYGPRTRNLRGARELELALAPHARRISAVLHGHEHHGYRTSLEVGGHQLPSLNPGAGGYAHLPGHGRTAHFCVYQIDAGKLQEVERYAFDGQQFLLEAGGPWASGG